MEYSRQNIGFSTGTLFKSDFKRGIDVLKKYKIKSIEISALRENEFENIYQCFHELNLEGFNHVSFHAPSKLINLSEFDLVNKLKTLINVYDMPIIVHPDIITDYSLWNSLGSHICIENMDKRKPIGRNCSELEIIFKKLPKAKLCFDLAHVRQIDPSLTEAVNILIKFKDRISQLHISTLNTMSVHEPLNMRSIITYSSLAQFIDRNIPIILESPVAEEKINDEIEFASWIFDLRKLKTKLSKSNNYNNYYNIISNNLEYSH